MERCTGMFFRRGKMTRPKTPPSRQTRRPNSSSLWPVMPFRKVTLCRSGRMRFASVRASCGWPASADSLGATEGLADGLATFPCAKSDPPAHTRSVARTSARTVQDFINPPMIGEVPPRSNRGRGNGGRIVADVRPAPIRPPLPCAGRDHARSGTPAMREVQPVRNLVALLAMLFTLNVVAAQSKTPKKKPAKKPQAVKTVAPFVPSEGVPIKHAASANRKGPAIISPDVEHTPGSIAPAVTQDNIADNICNKSLDRKSVV